MTDPPKQKKEMVLIYTLLNNLARAYKKKGILFCFSIRHLLLYYKYALQQTATHGNQKNARESTPLSVNKNKSVQYERKIVTKRHVRLNSSRPFSL